MNYSVACLIITMAVFGILNGMKRPHNHNQQQKQIAHTFYFDQAMICLKQKDAEKFKSYCQADPRLIPEIENIIKQDLEANKWSLDLINEIKQGNCSRL